MRILVLLQDDIHQQQRVAKVVTTLARAGHDVLLVQVPPRGCPGASVEGLAATRTLRLRTRALPRNLLFWPLKFAEMTWRMARAGRALRPDLVHCVNRITLLAGTLVAQGLGVPLVYDAQEIESGVRCSANWPSWFWLWFERTLARRAARVLVTDDFRCAIITALLRLDPARVVVLMSLPRLASLRRPARDLRADCGWPEGRLIVYFGAIMPRRHFEEAIDALKILPAVYRLVLVGFGDPGYVDTLRQRGQQAQLGTRLAILPPVHWSELPDYIGGADCAYVLYRQDSLNNYYCSPSKLFDALVGGVPVVGTDNPLIRRTIKECDAGVCVTSVTPDSLAQAVRTLTERDDLAAMKTRLRVEARVHYSWEQQEQRLLDLYAVTVAS